LLKEETIDSVEEDSEVEEETEEAIDLVGEIDNMEDHITEITIEDLNLKTLASIATNLVTLLDNVPSLDKIQVLEEDVVEEDMKEEDMEMMIEERNTIEEEVDQGVEVMIVKEETEVMIDIVI
jgi:hypothetical protein